MRKTVRKMREGIPINARSKKKIACERKDRERKEEAKRKITEKKGKEEDKRDTSYRET